MKQFHFLKSELPAVYKTASGKQVFIEHDKNDLLQGRNGIGKKTRFSILRSIPCPISETNVR